MAAPKPTDVSERPPPTLPNDPSISTQLTQYLRTFSLWCRTGFRDSLRSQEALPGILIRATDAATGAQTSFVYRVGVKVTVTGGVPSAPTMTFTQVVAGSGYP